MPGKPRRKRPEGPVARRSSRKRVSSPKDRERTGRRNATSSKKKKKYQEPDGYHGSEIDMEAVKRNNEHRFAKGTTPLVEASIELVKDPKEDMTFGRRIALSLIEKAWYNPPAADDDEDLRKSVNEIQGNSFYLGRKKPSLEKAWTYFEHVALNRFVGEDDDEPKSRNVVQQCLRRLCRGDRQLHRAELGVTDRKTKLYDPFNTPHSQLGDFGLGVGLYFSTLRAVGIIAFVAGLINILSMLYFASDEYMPAEARADLPMLLSGSAVCTETSWVPCPECQCTTREWESDRCNTVEIDGKLLTFALRNECDGAVWSVAGANYASLLFIFFSILCAGYFSQRAEVRFDEDEQTAQDYSIVIKNPPADAYDPDEWNEYFRKNHGAQMAVCTCALDNDLLVQALVKRRETYRKIKDSLEPGTPMDVISIALIVAEQERSRSLFQRMLAYIVPGVPENFSQLVVMNAKIQALGQLEYRATRVFVTFETEKDQRQVLEKLTVGTVQASRNDHSAVSDPKYLFRGNYVLSVSEAEEPNTIRWMSLNINFLQMLVPQGLTAICTLLGIVAVAMIVRLVNDYSAKGAAFTIAAANMIFPTVAKAFVNLESHSNEGSKQLSLYFKIALFRFVNTAVVITLITPFTSTLEKKGGLIPQVYAIFYAEILTANLIQLLDPVGHIKRHILAPRAMNQDAMNLFFQGEEIELAERYTNMTKIILLALWYSAIYPGAFFMCSAALFINYFTDRFSLMRTWKRLPNLGSGIARASRKVSISLAIVMMAVVSSLFWSGFPYDNLCNSGQEVAAIDSAYIGTFTIDDTFAIESTDKVYNYCVQNLIERGFGLRFPLLPSRKEGREGEWMTEEQEQITTVFWGSSVVIAAVIFAKIVCGFLVIVYRRYYASYKAVGEDQGINFSDMPYMGAYIPQVNSSQFSYPILICESDEIVDELFDWKDPERPYSFFDLTIDAKMLLPNVFECSQSGCFSRVKHWLHSEDENLDKEAQHDGFKELGFVGTGKDKLTRHGSNMTLRTLSSVRSIEVGDEERVSHSTVFQRETSGEGM